MHSLVTIFVVTLSLAVSKRVMSGDLVLKLNKKSKGSQAWDQFHIMWDPDKTEELYDIVCCSICKLCLLYKMLIKIGRKN